MATLFFTVFLGAVETASGDPIQEDKVTIGAGSLQSTVIDGTGRKRRRVRVFADTNCFATWGESPTAKDDGTAGRALEAGSAEYFDIEAGHKIAVIERT
jgi:hypothetical protein